MRRLFMYYVAFLMWIVKIILWISIILIPIERLLSGTYEEWERPFEYAKDELLW